MGGKKNTFKSIGHFPGIFVVIADVGKGAAAVFLARYLLRQAKITL